MIDSEKNTSSRRAASKFAIDYFAVAVVEMLVFVAVLLASAFAITECEDASSSAEVPPVIGGLVSPDAEHDCLGANDAEAPSAIRKIVGPALGDMTTRPQDASVAPRRDFWQRFWRRSTVGMASGVGRLEGPFTMASRGAGAWSRSSLTDPTREEAMLLTIAAYRCGTASWRRFDSTIGLAMLRAEERAGIGPGHPLRGNTLSQWCGEAAYGLGDDVCKTGPCDAGKARGPLQMHTGYARMCIDGGSYRVTPTPASDALRDDPVASAECYLGHVLRVYLRSSCATDAERWGYAELWVARGVRPSKCGLISGHVARLERWQKALRRMEGRR